MIKENYVTYLEDVVLSLLYEREPLITNGHMRRNVRSRSGDGAYSPDNIKNIISQQKENKDGI